jgi:hypothetical protein
MPSEKSFYQKWNKKIKKNIFSISPNLFFTPFKYFFEFEFILKFPVLSENLCPNSTNSFSIKIQKPLIVLKNGSKISCANAQT